MAETVRRLFVEKREGFNSKAVNLLSEMQGILHIEGLSDTRFINRYDVQGLSAEDFDKAAVAVFSEPAVDDIFFDDMVFADGETVFAIEPLPGQYDQTADFAAQCAQMISGGERPLVRAAKVIALCGDIGEKEIDRIKKYLINPIECREVTLDKFDTLIQEYPPAPDVETIGGFARMDGEALSRLHEDMGLVMSMDDLVFCAEYFRGEENRDPTVAELRIIDTYWSDHCRHTTFNTELPHIEICGQEAGARDCADSAYIMDTFGAYERMRAETGGALPRPLRPVTLMDIATIAARKARMDGKLNDLEVSDEVNACSIEVSVDVGGEMQDWLVMFKNETHNHPTEIEPLGGAATCLGGAIRDPLSGRSFVYQAMRVTGSADPRADVADTIAGKLPQRVITRSAAEGYSLYGNQIGVPTGHVREIYHPGYVAKRMELGAVVSAAPKEYIIRKKPESGDAVILLGGRTGRDGIGGATGSSKKHDEGSLANCGAEVQKGCPPIERSILRLFRKPQASRLIKKCNDFGAGGVAVAVGELAPGLSINLDDVPVKYGGLGGAEIALSESQERMAVVTAGGDAAKFIEMAADENLEATIIASVNDSDRMLMHWRGAVICDLSRGFLDSNGAPRKARAAVYAPDLAETGKHVAFYSELSDMAPGEAGGVKTADASQGDDVPGKTGDAKTANGGETASISPGCNASGAEGAGAIKSKWLANLENLNVCCQAGLAGMFDSTAGGNTVLMPFGGKFQRTPVEGMAAKIPVPGGESMTATLMTYGFDPFLSAASPFHGGLYAVVESLAKLAALGGNAALAKLTFQEYFEQLGSDPARWGKPLAALLGALRAQLGFDIAAVGGKDSMSGSFEDLDAPPTLVSFAIAPSDAREIISPEFKHPRSLAALLAAESDPAYPGALLPDIARLKQSYASLYEAIRGGKVLAAYPVREGGIAAAVSMMCFGNGIGFDFDKYSESLFAPLYGSIVLELAEGGRISDVIPGARLFPLGKTSPEPFITAGGASISIGDALKAWEAPLDGVFPLNDASAHNGVFPVAGKSESSGRNAGDDATACTKTSSAHTVAKASENAGSAYAGDEVNASEKTRYAHVGADARTINIGAAKPRVLLIVPPGANSEYECAYAFERAGATTRMAIIKNNSAKAIVESAATIDRAIGESEIIMLPGGYGAGGEPDVAGEFTATFLRKERLRDAIEKFLDQRGGLLLGLGSGFRTLLATGLLPFGKIAGREPGNPALVANISGRFISRAADIIVCDNASPWLSFARTGDIFSMPVAHAEGRFYARDEMLSALEAGGRIALCYAGPDGGPAEDETYNPGGSRGAVAGISGPDGRVFGMTGRPERAGTERGVLKNIYGNKGFDIFKSGVEFFM